MRNILDFETNYNFTCGISSFYHISKASEEGKREVVSKKYNLHKFNFVNIKTLDTLSRIHDHAFDEYGSSSTMVPIWRAESSSSSPHKKGDILEAIGVRVNFLQNIQERHYQIEVSD